MRILITGGCGFLGSNLAADALLRGDELMVFDNLYRSGSRENLAWLQTQGRFVFEHSDIRNQNDITRVVQSFKPEAIFHLAGQVAMTTSIANPRMDFEVNVMRSRPRGRRPGRTRMAVARPTPVDAPVTTTVLFAKSIVCPRFDACRVPRSTARRWYRSPFGIPAMRR